MNWVNFPALGRSSFFVFAASSFFCWFLTVAVRFSAERFRLFAKRDLRRKHKRNVPLLGGIGFFAVLVLLTSLFYFLPEEFRFVPVDGRFTFFFLAGALVVFGVGVLDDIFEIPPGFKFGAQLLAGFCLLASSSEVPQVIKNVPVQEGFHFLAYLIWIVGTMNAVNMIDGMDGLCTGIVAIVASNALVMAMGSGGQPQFNYLLSISLVGACFGFLIHNFFPARIFLGESGSALLGYLAAFLAANAPTQGVFWVDATIPLLMLGIPLLDMCLAIFRRARMGRAIFNGDRGHLHHQLQQLGIPHRAIVLILWGWTLFFNGMAWSVSRSNGFPLTFIYVFGLLGAGTWFFGLRFVRRRLSFQADQLTRLFLRNGVELFGNDQSLFRYLTAQFQHSKKDHIPFTVLTLEVDQIMGELTGARPERAVELQMSVLSILMTRLRQKDHVARVSGNRIVAIIAGIDGRESEVDLMAFLIKKLRETEENFGVYQSEPDQVVGLKIHVYPQDGRKIQNLLESLHPSKEQHAKSA